MEAEKLEALRYPIGKFKDPEVYSSNDIARWIREIEEAPKSFRQELKSFNDEMLDETYRPDGWTARQVIHHVVDSHLNAYIRFKLTLTEDKPVIKPYNETQWAELIDSKLTPVEVSLLLLESLHHRFVIVLKSIKENELTRSYFHPANNREYSLKTAMALYAWHGKHHLEHIRIVKRKFAVAQS